MPFVSMKWHEEAQIFVMVDFVREMNVKKSCENGRYGSFKHLLSTTLNVIFGVLIGMLF